MEIRINTSNIGIMDPYSDMKQLEDFLNSENWTNREMDKSSNEDILHLSIYNTTETVFLILAYVIIVVLSLIGNTAVCFVVLKVKNFQNSTYILLTNIACSDIFITVLNIPLTLTKILLDKWIFGEQLCKIANFSLMVSVYVSAYTMSAIALDKYMCMVYPLRAKWTNLGVQLLCVVTWLAAILIALPFFLFSTLKEEDMAFQVSVRCVVAYPPPSVVTEKFMTAFTFAMQFLIPVTITSVCYGNIICKVYAHLYRPAKSSRNRSLRDNTHRVTSQFKLVKMLMLVVLLFTICWLPLNTYHLLLDFYTGNDITHHSVGYLTCHWLAMSNVCYNPIIYCWMHGAFRRQIAKCFRSLRDATTKHGTKTPREQVTHL